MIDPKDIIEGISRMSIVGVGLFDVKEFRLLTHTGFVARLIGMEPNAFLERATSENFGDLVHPDDAPMLNAHFRDRMPRAKVGEIFELEYRLVVPDGTIHWVLERDTVHAFDPDGSVRVIMITIASITRLKSLELKLEEHTRKLQLTGQRDLRRLRQEVTSMLDLVDELKKEKSSPSRRQKLLTYMRAAAEALQETASKLSDGLNEKGQ